MENKKKIDYASAGVNLKAADQAVAKIKKLANSTFNTNVLSDIVHIAYRYPNMNRLS